MRPSGRKDVAMHQGHYVFAQLMQHLPLTTFRRCVARYDGERRVKRFSCLDRKFARSLMAPVALVPEAKVWEFAALSRNVQRQPPKPKS
jgi:Domain of unknown function (DUF4372)